MDVMTREQRHKAMRSNRGRTGPERAFASLLWKQGFRFLTAEGYRTWFGKPLLGQPDLIFTRKKVLIFVDGCFWHGCRLCHDFRRDCSTPWQAKIQTNVRRDRRNVKKLAAQGWHVVRVWEHNVRRKDRMLKTVKRISRLLRSRRR
ncbi:MAG: DNA mismatch endonuclease Vsr [Candidatus Eisenbacteria bacterium]